MIDNVNELHDHMAFIDERLSYKIRFLSFIAACAVILQHMSSGILADGICGRFWRQCVAYGILDYPVSFFFLLSGYFLSANVQRGWWQKAMKKRFSSLLFPYCIWTTLGWFVLDCRISYLEAIGVTRLLPSLPALWYIKILFILCLVSIVLRKLLQLGELSMRVKLIIWSCFYGIFASGCLFCNLPLQKTAIFSVLFFMLGLILSATRLDGWLSTLKVSSISLVLLGLLVAKSIAVAVYGVPESFLRWFIVPVTIAFVWRMYDDCSIFSERILVLKNKYVSQILHGTFFLYCCGELMHVIFMELGVHVLNVTGAVCAAALIIILAIICMFCLSWISPFVYRILSGGR